MYIGYRTFYQIAGGLLNIGQYIGYQPFFASSIGIRVGPKNPVSVGLYSLDRNPHASARKSFLINYLKHSRTKTNQQSDFLPGECIKKIDPTFDGKLFQSRLLFRWITDLTKCATFTFYKSLFCSWVAAGHTGFTKTTPSCINHDASWLVQR